MQCLKTSRDLIGLGIKTLSVLLPDIHYINPGSDTVIFDQFFADFEVGTACSKALVV